MIELWFKATDLSSSREQVLYEEGGATSGFNLYLKDGQLYAGAWSEDFGWQGTWLSTSEVQDSTWHHVALNFRQFALNAFLDGKPFGAQRLESDPKVGAHGDGIAVGAIRGATKFEGAGDHYGTDHYFEGQVDQLRLWNRTSGAETIWEVARRTIEPGEEETRVGDLPAWWDLIAWYRFDAGSGTTAFDYSTGRQVLNGTFAGDPKWTDFSGAGLGQSSEATSDSYETVTAGPAGIRISASGNFTSDSNLHVLQIYQYNDVDGPVVDSSRAGEDFSNVQTSQRLSAVWGIGLVGDSTSADVTLDLSGLEGANDSTGIQLLRRKRPGMPWGDVTDSWTFDAEAKSFSRNGVSSTGQYAVGGAVQSLLQPEQVEVEIRRTFGETRGPGDYRLVALPGAVDTSLARVLPGEARAEWQAYWDNGSSENYLVEYDGSGAFTFRPGRGFWLTSRQDWAFTSSVNTVSLRGVSTATIPLHDGWNIIANPLGEDVPWTMIETANGDSLQPAWAFSGSFRRADTLRSAATGKAYYFLNEQGLDSLRIPYPRLTTAVKGNTVAAESQVEQEAVMSLIAETGKSHRSQVQVGIDPEAAGGLGPRDVVAPPSQFSKIGLRLVPRGEHSPRRDRLAAEWRSPASKSSDEEQGHTFSLRLRSQASIPVEIRAEGLQRLNGRQVVLLRPSTGQRWDLRKTGAVTLREADSTALKLAVGSASYVQDKEQEVVPDEITLSSYPNPMRRQATIEYTLTEPTDVRITVYDVLGRRVAVLADGRKKAGRHRLQLDGSRLASGVYFGRLKTEDQTRTQKITVVR